MKNYYKILEVQSDAKMMDVKKAYFGKVRKYPPDRYPEEFMEIREAYETLSNEKTRLEYDSIFTMPLQARQGFELARKAMGDGEFHQAINLLEHQSVMNPDILLLQGLLGEAYLANGNSGKAVEIFERLTQIEPYNAGFAGHFAHACLERGWHKKALKAYKKALELDEDNISLWQGFSEAHMKGRDVETAREIILEALEKGRNKDWDEAGLYFHVIQLDLITNKTEEMHKHIDELLALAVQQPDIREHAGWFLAQLAHILMLHEKIEDANMIINCAMELIPDDESILKLKKRIEKYSHTITLLDALEQDTKVPKEIVNLIALEVLPDEETGLDMIQKDAIRFMNELTIIERSAYYRADLLYVRNKYPELYAEKAEFFDDILEPAKAKKMLGRYRSKKQRYQSIINMLAEQDDYDPWDEEENYDYEPQEPYVRENPKIGRNDPCPCGSGKKYKKCCGK